MGAHALSAAGYPGAIRPRRRHQGWTWVRERFASLWARSSSVRRLFRLPGSRRRFPGRGAVCSRRHLRFEVPCRPEMTRTVRERAAEFARAMPFTNEEIEDIRLAVGEAAVNAVRHGANPKWPKVGVELWRKGRKLRVAVWDRGRGFDPRTPCRKSECLAASGRGVMFMKSLMDDVRFQFTKPGTRVEMTKTASAGRSSDSRRRS